MTQRRKGKASTRTPDCRTCGVCCVSLHDQDVYCDVTPADIKRMGPRASRHVASPSPFYRLLSELDGREAPMAIVTKWRTMQAGPLKGLNVCACVFLNGSVLHRTSCRIYKKRPKSCREACNPGDKHCLEARRLFQDLVERVADG
jgi:Fe-S-cluster containining protein